MKTNFNNKLHHYGFPSIKQFAELTLSVIRQCTYVGRDENDDPIYDATLPKPILDFIGTVKLHGTNSGIVIDFHNNNIYYLSREKVITPNDDNAGFATYMSSIEDDFMTMISNYLNSINENYDWENNIMVIYGEWCGGNIQKSVALNKLEKRYVIFSAAIRGRENTESRNIKWFSIDEVNKLKLIDKKIYNIYDYKTWKISINFSDVSNSISNIEDWVIDVENTCPFAKEFGVDGVGEGIVFKCITEGFNNSDFWFKSKGDKHAKKKDKQLLPVDNEKINHLISIAETVTPSWRLEQMFNETFNIINGGQPSRDKIGEYVKNVLSDIKKEEVITLNNFGVSLNDISKYVNKIITNYYFQMEKDFIINL